MTEVKKVPKKRGRKPKKKNPNEPKPPPKKRGRKPKGGKIIKKNQKIQKNEIIHKPNIILHLKCNSKDLNTLQDFNTSYNPSLSNPESYNIYQNNKLGELQYEEIKQNTPFSKTNIIVNDKQFNSTSSDINTDSNKENVNIKELWNKLNILKRNLRTNNVSDKRSACFWCTYEFDNPAVHIPKQYNGDVLEVYGCFCSRECACS